MWQKQLQMAEVSEKLRLLLNILCTSLKVWKLYPWCVLCHLLGEIRQFLVEGFCFSFSELGLGQPLKNLVETDLPLPSLTLCLPGSTSTSKSLMHCREIHPTSSFQTLISRNKKQTTNVIAMMIIWKSVLCLTERHQTNMLPSWPSKTWPAFFHNHHHCILWYFRFCLLMTERGPLHSSFLLSLHPWFVSDGPRETVLG